MKKSVLIPIMLTVALASTTLSTYAKVNKTTTPSAVKTEAAVGVTTRVVPVLMPQEIKGVIEKITETEMTVKTKEGKSYWIPILGFSELEGFKNLKLKVDTEVSLKGLQPQKMTKDGVTLGIGGIAVSKAVMAVKGIPAADLKDAKKLDNAEGKTFTFSTDGSVGQENQAGEIAITEGSITGKAIPSTDLKDIKSLDIAGVSGVVGAKTFTFSDKDHEGKDIFMPEEITANGVTVKLFDGENSITTKAFPMAKPEEVKGTIEKLNENEMTVKTKDGKSYWMPTLGFSELKEFTDLKLKVGTEVTLKGMQPQMLKSEGVTAGFGGIAISNASITESASVSIDAKDVKDLGQEGIKTFEISAKDHEGEAMFMPEEITANGITVRLFENNK